MSHKVPYKLISIILLSISQALGNPIERRSIDEATFANLQLYEQFAAAAYCPSNDNITTGGTQLTCPLSNNCPLVEADNITTIYEFENSPLTDVTGYIALSPTHNLTILAFRGSHTIRNWLADADIALVPTDLCDLCTCAQGFYASWLEARPGVLSALQSAISSFPDYGLVVTGHSLGGAIADIAAAEIRKTLNVECDLYTYGAPRIAGPVLSEFISNQEMGGNYRVTHFDDPVPRLPPRHFGFVHLSPEYYISTPSNVVPTAEDVTMLLGDVNLNGNTPKSGGFGDDFGAHLWYFNGVADCSPSGLQF